MSAMPLGRAILKPLERRCASRPLLPREQGNKRTIWTVRLSVESLRDYLPQRTTILVPGGTMAPGSGACWREVPLPMIWTSRPAAAACSMTWRTGRPTSEGTRRRVRQGGRRSWLLAGSGLAAAGGDGGCADGAMRVWRWRLSCGLSGGPACGLRRSCAERIVAGQIVDGIVEGLMSCRFCGLSSSLMGADFGLRRRGADRCRAARQDTRAPAAPLRQRQARRHRCRSRRPWANRG